MKKIIRSTILIIIGSLLVSPIIFGQFFDQEGAVKPDIEYKTENSSGTVIFNFNLKPDNHITDLKNGFFTINLEKNEYASVKGVTFPNGEPYGDEYVFKGEFSVSVYLKILKKLPDTGADLNFEVSYQICQEKPVEVCYPPETDKISVHISGDFKEVKSGITLSGKNDKKSDFAGWIENKIKKELEKRSVLLFFLVFIGGFLTSFTPCVYPVIPIVMGYIGTRSGKSRFKGFYLSIFFVLGLAFVYSILGVVAAMTGSMMGLTFQNPVVVLVIAVIFITMGLSLAGFFEIPVPSSISSKVRPGNKSEIIGALVVGGVSGIIAAPCVGPVLIALLSYISQTGNLFLGFWLTFVFSLGLGVIFLIAGTFSGAISSMPKGGKWMDYVKYMFSLLLIGGGLYFLGLISSGETNLILWGIFLIAIPVFAGIFKLSDDENLGGKIFRLILVLLLITGSYLFVKGLNGKFFPGENSKSFSKAENVGSGINWIDDLEEGMSIAKKKNRYIIADSYADWCVACKELDENTFSSREVKELLSDFVPVKMDFTESNTRNDKIRKRLKIIGMPTVIFFNSKGDEIERFSGFYDKDKFIRFVKEKVLIKNN